MPGTKRPAEMSCDHPPTDGAQEEANKKRKLELASFTQFLNTHVPAHLLPSQPSEYLAAQGNRRLAMAAEKGLAVADLRIGMDYLPEWQGGPCWDAEEEGLGVHIQARLLDYEASREVRFLRNQLISIGNKRLEEAAALGMGVGRLSIGSDLLPTWVEAGAADEDVVVEMIEDDAEMEDDDSHSQAGSVDSEDLSAQSSITLESLTSDNVELDGFTDDSSTTSSDTDDDSFDDVIYLDNPIHPNPTYEDPDYCGDEHIFHNAEIVGAPVGFGDVDLEVYLVDDGDSELEHMPEIEMGIDRAGYEHYHDTDEAIDVEIPGVDVRCTLDLPGSEERLQQAVNEGVTGTNEHRGKTVGGQDLSMKYPGYAEPRVSDNETDMDDYSEEE
jgi:hypothetical protein